MKVSDHQDRVWSGGLKKADLLYLIPVKSQSQSLHISAKLGSRETVSPETSRAQSPWQMLPAILTLPVLRAPG